MKLSKADRILSERDFAQVFRMAHSRTDSARRSIVSMDAFVIYSSGTSGKPRLGLSISRKTIRRAHDRNRVKRIVREFFRLHKNEMKGDIIVRLMRDPQEKSYSALTRPLRRLLDPQGSTQ